MSTCDSTISTINIYWLKESGSVSATRYKLLEGIPAFQLCSKTAIVPADVSFDIVPSFNLNRSSTSSTIITPISGENNNVEIVQIFKFEHANDLEQIKHKPKLNIPFMIRCQNCETNYPTKYQYQRHQCEFNAEKVVLKPNADFIDLEKGKRIKYDCPTCGKQFVSKNNLERHQSSHDNSKDNTCEHCKKQFVSENRLRIHKENHCKKAGDISKFYRSDVTVWKCARCHEVFSSSTTAGFHVEQCTEFIDDPDIIKQSPDSQQQKNQENKTIQKISTEILLQCEFCNRTFADKQILIKHQKTHKTDKNYECVICNEVFTSYITASQHWLKKCSDKANLFYLPKLTYCEFCDRTFKSHEILYTHKIKKKHYTPKVFNDCSTIPIKTPPLQTIKNEDAIDKLIEDVLIALEIPLNKRTNRRVEETATTNEEEVEKIDEEDTSVQIKSEPDVNEQGESSSGVPEKKKRGRKRKILKQPSKSKKPCYALDEGLKYQCERCIKIWDTVTELENHREEEHATNFNCDECGHVSLYCDIQKID